MDIKILSQTTPNPNARKFIINRTVKSEGKATFSSKQEAEFLPLVRDMFDIAGIEQVHLFDNFITVTKNEENDWHQVEPQVRAIVQTRMPIHEADFNTENMQIKHPIDRAHLPPEVRSIEEILDRTIRPGLQGDGGDLEVVGLENGILSIRYEGACGTCPSSVAGTLQAIESILQNEFDPNLRVQAV